MRRLAIVLSMLLLTVAQSANARLYIEISKNLDTAMPIAIVPFAWKAPAPALEDIGAIVSADLARCGRFAPIDPAKLPAQPHTGSEVNFSQWRGSGSDNLVVGQVVPQGDKFLVQFQLFDVVKGSQLIGYSIPADKGTLRTVAHQISDLIYAKLTGEPGAFNTYIAYVTVERDAKGQTYRLAVADADGYNEQIILTSPKPLLSPTWSPDGHKLAYVSFEHGSSEVFIQDVFSGKRESVAHFDGVNGAPAFSPDGKRLALTLSRDGNSEVYVMDLATHKLTRVTHNYAIDTEPAWAPDGKSLVFTSDRGGLPQIYRVDIEADGTPTDAPQRVTFEGKYNARATFSPDGKLLALVDGDGTNFRIATLNLENDNMQVLTHSQLDESPSFAPNGAMIIFATEENNRGVLEAVSVDGRANQRLSLQQGDVREPAWSPFLKN